MVLIKSPSEITIILFFFRWIQKSFGQMTMIFKKTEWNEPSSKIARGMFPVLI
jgi:hypothetical protein